MKRLEQLDLGEGKIDFDDITDHINELGSQKMNGREIRNAITTGRQLAQFKGEAFATGI